VLVPVGSIVVVSEAVVPEFDEVEPVAVPVPVVGGAEVAVVSVVSVVIPVVVVPVAVAELVVSSPLHAAIRSALCAR